MDAMIKKVAVMLIMIVFLFRYISVNMEVVYSDSTYGTIDLFTQKEPYSGKGSNMPSDAFGPGEIVILYALVDDDGVPLRNLLVTFYVQSPDDTSFSLTAKTNTSGIATINFTIPQKCVNETAVFGEWFTCANVMIGTDPYQDELTFTVDWIVKLISVRTIDENITYRANFGVGGDVGLEIALRNVAMCLKNAMFAIAVQDELGVIISYCEIHDFDVQPNGKLILLYCKLHLPKWARIGQTTVFVSALTAPASQNGVPYCPAISTSFFIRTDNPLAIAFHDAAVVTVVPSAKSVELGQLLNVSVVVRNEGTEIESFNVNAYCGDVLIGTLEIAALSPYFQTTLNFTLNTSSFEAGNYTVSAFISYLVDEADLTDNTLVDGVVELKPKLSPIIHNIAIVDVNVSNNTVYIGDLLQINVSVLNKGTETETFDVETYYDSSLIEILQISDLAPSGQATLTFVWNTSFACEGFYEISASAPLPDDIDTSDNIFIDGVVQVKPSPLLKFHDVAVLTVSSSALVYVGEVVEVFVVVGNLGNFTETFNLIAYADLDAAVIGDEIIIGSSTVESSKPNDEKSLVFYWDTLCVAEGCYVLSVLAGQVSGEKNLDNNLYVDGVVEVRARPPPLMIHDVAVLSVFPSSTVVYVGEVVEVFVVVGNLGNFTETFNLIAYADLDAAVIGDEIIIGSSTVESSKPNDEKSLVFYWDTLCVAEGCYVLSVLAGQVSGEKNLDNNLCVDGVVQVKPSPPLKFHDVGVLTVSSSSTLVRVGEVVEIFVVVKNHGNFTESFDVTAYADVDTAVVGDEIVIGVLTVENLEANSQKTLVFQWNTQNVMEGNYTLSASATIVPGEENLENNSYEDGVVTVVEAPKEWYVPSWFYWLLLLLLILTIILMIAWYYRRKRRKRAEEAFYSGWTAWYYGYDMQNRTSKSRIQDLSKTEMF